MVIGRRQGVRESTALGAPPVHSAPDVVMGGVGSRRSSPVRRAMPEFRCGHELVKAESQIDKGRSEHDFCDDAHRR